MKSIIYIISISLISTLCGCYENKKNNEYQDIRELSIEYLMGADGKDSVYNAITNEDTLRIDPIIKINLGLEFNNDDYEYNWYLDLEEPLQISNERKLTYPVELIAGGYRIYLIIKDKNTGLKIDGSYVVNVSNLYSKGLLVLTEDKDQYAKLDMISMVRDTFLNMDILSSSNVPKYKKPFGLFMGVSYNFNDIQILTKDGDYKVNSTTLRFDPNKDFFKFLMMAPREMWENKIVENIVDPAGRTRSIYLNNYIFNQDPYAGGIYGYPINVYSKEAKPFRVAPLFASNYKVASTSAKCFVMYDIDNKGFSFFHQQSNGGVKSSKLSDTSSDIHLFTWKTDLDFVTTFHSYSGQYGESTTILKNNTNYYAYRYDVVISKKSAVKKKRVDITDATDINLSENYFASSTQAYIFYTVGSKIYGYDLDYGRKGSLVLDLEDTITAVYDAPYYGNPERGKNFVYIATYGGTPGSGKIHKYSIVSSTSEIKMVCVEDSEGNDILWEGFDKIVSILHR